MPRLEQQDIIETDKQSVKKHMNSANQGMQPFKTLKKYMPKRLLARATMILLLPMLLTQIILGYIFIERHTQRIVRMLAKTISGDIAYVINAIEADEQLTFTTKYNAKQLFDLNLKLLEGKNLIASTHEPHRWLHDPMQEALRERLTKPFQLRLSHKFIHIAVELPQGVLKIKTSRKRLHSRTTEQVLIWTFASSLLLLIIALVFLRNQIRPIHRLAHAAEQFGRSQTISKFKPEGATEVRRAGQAFIIMRQRLTRLMNNRMEALAGISHDLRTPLTRMKLQLEMMQGNKHEIETLKSDVKIMQEMVSSFLNFARDMEHEPAVRVYIRNELIKVIEQSGFEKNNWCLDCPEEQTILAQPLLINRCLTNLVSNTKRYATKIWVSVRNSDSYTKIYIEDDGPGIPQSSRTNVLKPFVRLDGSRNNDMGGTGLGLTIAKDAVEAHGGKLTLDDSKHGGLKVIIAFPN